MAIPLTSPQLSTTTDKKTSSLTGLEVWSASLTRGD